MDLTSLLRLRFSYGIGENDKDGLLTRLISSSSMQIAGELRRVDQEEKSALETRQRTEYIDPREGQRSFYLKAYPVASVVSVHYDSTGRYSGDETEVDEDDYQISSDRRALVFSYPMPVKIRGLRVVYSGGMSEHATTSEWLVNPAGVFTAGKFIQGSISGFIAKVLSFADPTYDDYEEQSEISFTLLSGRPQVGETVTEYSVLDLLLQNGGLSSASGVTGALLSPLVLSLSEYAPDLVEAAEMHVDHMMKNRNHFGNLQVLREGETKFSLGDMQKDFFSHPYVRSLLNRHYNRLSE